MNLLAARVALRPRTLTEVLDLAGPWCRANAGLLARLGAPALGLLAAVAAGLRLGMGWPWAGVWALLLPLAWLSTGLFTLAFGEALFRPPAEVAVRPLLRRYLRRLPVLVGAQLARLLLVAGCALGLMVPLAFEGPRWLFLHEALLLEHAGLGPAIRRSRALGRRLGFCLGLGLALLLLPALLAVLAELVGVGLLGFVFQLGQPFGDLRSQGGSGLAVLGLLLAVPLGAAARFLGYLDLRTRGEGWDIQLRFQAWAEEERGRDRSGRRPAA